jgi:hypothetical protein
MKNEPTGCAGTLALRNSLGSKVMVHLEPWGDQFSVEPGAILEVEMSGPTGGCLEIEVSEGAITVYGWEGSILSARQRER